MALASPILQNNVYNVRLGDGTGEFRLDPSPFVKVSVSSPDKIQINHNTNDVSDIITSLNELQSTFPNVSVVTIPIAWYVTDLRCDNTSVKPGVTSRTMEVEPTNWMVCGQNRFDTNVYLVKNAGKNGFAGTPTDSSILRLCIELAKRNISVVLVPTLLVDIDDNTILPNPYSDYASDTTQTGYPSSNKLTISVAPGYAGSTYGSADAAAEISKFFGSVGPSDLYVSITRSLQVNVEYTSSDVWTYSKFIMHYTKLCAAINMVMPGSIIGFSVGSQLSGLTSIIGVPGSFPAVDALSDLAQKAKSVLGAAVKVGYVADYGEWHSYKVLNSPGDVIFNMDKLWSNTAVDFIGISWNAPLTDWHGTPNDPDRRIFSDSNNPDYIKYGMSGGLDFDYVYKTPSDLLSGSRSYIFDNLGKPWLFRQKDLISWWKNNHHNRIGGVDQVSSTGWIPQSKPFWLLDLPVRPINNGGNYRPYFPTQPPAFVDTLLPTFSDGKQNLGLYQTTLEVFTQWWNNLPNNPLSDSYNRQMVDPSFIAVSYWDARPFPWFPKLSNQWIDGTKYPTSLTLNGRFDDYVSSFPIFVDAERLLPDNMANNSFWTDLTSVMTKISNPTIHNAVNQLLNLRDPNIIEDALKPFNVRMLGYEIPLVGLSAIEYDRLMRDFGTYLQTRGARDIYAKFLSYIKNAEIRHVPLFLNGLDINTLSDTPGALFLDGGTWIPSVYCAVSYDADVLVNINESLFRQQINGLKPQHLVIKYLVGTHNFDGTDVANIYIEAKDAYDSKTITSVSVEETFGEVVFIPILWDRKRSVHDNTAQGL